MRIVIDMQGAQNGSRYRGIGRYTLALTEGILRVNSSHEIILVLNDLFPDSIESIRSYFYGKLPQQNIRIWVAPGPVSFLDENNIWRRQAAEFLREAFLQSLDPDVVLISSMFEGAGDDVVTSIARFTDKIKTAVVVYDLIPLLNSELYLADEHVNRWYMEKLVHLKKADIWLAISESSRQEAIDHAQLPPDKIFNISTAVDKAFSKVDLDITAIKEIQDSVGITRSFVMYCSASDPRKNHLRLISAYAKLPKHIRDKHQLVLAGGMPENHIMSFKRHAKQVGLALNEMIITGYVDDTSMIALYHSCKCFVFPSWHEGFGLPALEAMSCGAAVIGANTSSVPEVIGHLDALFDPFSEDDISEKISKVLMDDVFRQELIKHGHQQCKKFSWDLTAKRVLSAFEELLRPSNDESNDTAQLNQLAKPPSNEIISNLIDVLSELPRSLLRNNDLRELAAAIDLSIVDDNRSRRLFIDISELVQRDSRTGIQRVVRSIVNALLEFKSQDYVIEFVYASTVEPYRKANNYIARFQGGTALLEDDSVIDARSGDIFLGLDFQDVIVSSQAAYYKKIKLLGVQVFFVVYDLLPIKLSDYFSLEVRKNYENWLHVITNANGAICISKEVADQLSSWVTCNTASANKSFSVDWFHLGADIDASEPSKGMPDSAVAVLSALDVRPSFLMVGTLEPRKRYAQAFAAFEILWTNGIDANLVFVGKPGWMMETLIDRLRHHPEQGKRLFWLEGISDEYLEEIYAASTCLIAASEGEGFGLPLIEAAQHKLPIIARDIPVFREVAGKHALYFDGLEPSAMSETVKTWLAMNAEGKAPQSTNMPWLTWKQSAEQLISRILPA